MRRVASHRATPLSKCFQSLLMVMLALGNSLRAADSQSAFLDAQTLYDAWEANYTHFRSVKFRLTERIISANGPGTQGLVPISHLEVIRDEGRSYGRKSPSAEGFTEASPVVVTSFDGSIAKIYRPWRKEAEIHQGLTGQAVEWRNPVEDYMLATRAKLHDAPGRRIGPHRELLNRLVEEFPEGCPFLTVRFRMAREEGKLRVLPELQEVAGKMCHVLEMGDYESGLGQRCWLAHECGMLVMRYVDNVHGDSVNNMQVQEVGKSETEAGIVWYPLVATWESKNSGTTMKQELRVNEFTPHVKVSPDTFDIKFPPGTRVIDNVANVFYVQGMNPALEASALNDVLDTIDDSTNRGKNTRSRDVEEREVVQDRETPEKVPVLADSATSTEEKRGDRWVRLLVLSLIIAGGLLAFVLWTSLGKRCIQPGTRSREE